MKMIILFFLIFQSTLYSKSLMTFMEEANNLSQIQVINTSTDESLITLRSNKEERLLYPDISNDGSLLSYLKLDVDGKMSVILHDLKSHHETKIFTSELVFHPQFNLDSKYLSFTQVIENESKVVIYDIKNKRVLKTLNFKIQAFFPSLNYDGDKLLYHESLNKERDVVLYSVKEEKELLRVPNAMAPTWSFDQSQIAYTSKRKGLWGIYTYNLSSKEESLLFESKDDNFAPTFRPNGEVVFASRSPEKNFSLYHIKNGKKVLLVQKKDVSLYAPKFSGDTLYDLSSMKDINGSIRSSFASTFDGKNLFVIGGHVGPEHTYPPESFVGDVSMFDGDTWIELAPRPLKGHGYEAVTYKGKVYAFGGFTYAKENTPAWKSSDQVHVYDPLTNTWSELPSMPRKRSSYVAERVGNKVYFIGGWDSTPKFENDLDGYFHDAIDVFNLDTYEWSTLETKITMKRRAFSSFVYKGQIYIAGGISEGAHSFSLVDRFEVFDPILETFKTLPSLPFATFAPAANILNDQAFIFGGMFSFGKYMFDYVPHIYSFDFEKEKWTHTGLYLQSKKGFSQVSNYKNNCLAILGGHSYDQQTDAPLADFEKFCLK